MQTSVFALRHYSVRTGFIFNRKRLEQIPMGSKIYLENKFFLEALLVLLYSFYNGSLYYLIYTAVNSAGTILYL